MLHMEKCAKTFLAFLHALGISFCAILCALAFFLFFFCIFRFFVVVVVW